METSAPKKPALAAFLSAVLPGLGQFYCRQWRKGTAFLVAGLGTEGAFGVTSKMMEFLRFGHLPQPIGPFVFASFLLAGIAIWSIIDATRTAKRAAQ